MNSAATKLVNQAASDIETLTEIVLRARYEAIAEAFRAIAANAPIGEEKIALLIEAAQIALEARDRMDTRIAKTLGLL